MINSIKIAFRNTLRNKRRTLLSILAIGVGGFASLLIGSFVSSINKGIQTGIARDSGHIHIHQKGYFDFGMGKVGQYDIEDYEYIISKIKESKINKYISVITPTLNISGIAGNYDKESSQTFIGLGLVAKDQIDMQNWDGFSLNNTSTDKISFEDFKNAGVIGQGLAINLDMCQEFHILTCKEQKRELNDNPVDEDISTFLEDETETTNDDVTINLLSASSKGAPNIIKLKVSTIWKKTQKEIDDRFIALPLDIAQRLVYGSGTKKINNITIQLQSPKNIAEASQILEKLFLDENFDLEIIPLELFNPQFNKIIGMFNVIFGFVSLIIGLIVIFTISNTMTMSIMERFNEIGTLRSMGLRRSGVRSYFLLEGSIIGFLGATAGVVFAIFTTKVINAIGIMWTPPSNAEATKLVFNLLDSPLLMLTVWGFLIILSIVSSLLPAIKASKMKIVDALRHN